MKKNLLFIFALFSIQYTASAQHELTLFHMNNVFQGTYVNPTLVPEHKVSIGLPGISSVYSGLYNSAFTANDLKSKEGNDVQFNMDKAISQMSPNNNYMNTSVAIDLLSIRFKVRNVRVSLNATNIFNTRFNYPKDLMSFAWNGNAQFINSSAQFDGFGINVMHYNEYALGLTRAKDGGKFVYGARLKFLQGYNNMYTERSKASFGIDPLYYQYTLNADMLVRTSSVVPYDSSMSNISSNDMIKYATNFKNLGWGIDLGLSYMPNKKLAFTGAVNNIGSISWQTNTKAHAVDGSYRFDGVNLDEVIAQGDSFNFKNYLDTLQKEFKVKETSGQKYKTPLTPSVYLSVIYSLGRSTKVSLTGYGEFYHGLRPAGSVAFIQRAGRILNFVVSYTIRKNSYNNVGLGLMLKPGPFQIYVVGDNALAFLNPFNTNNVNVRTGVNLVFGKNRKPEMQTHNEE